MSEPAFEVVETGTLYGRFALDATILVDGRPMAARIAWDLQRGTAITWTALDDGPAYEPDILIDPDDVAWLTLSVATGLPADALRSAARGQVAATWLTNGGLLAATSPRVRDTAVVLAGEMGILAGVRAAEALG